MAKRNSPRLNINLSSKGKQTVGKVVYGWTIDAGRAIIVIIELIALIALGYRFIIDRKIVDLHDQIKTQGLFIRAQESDEKAYRSIQDRLENIKSTNEETAAKVQIMNEILKAISAGTFFSANLSINDRSVLIDGSTFSIFTLTDFLNSLKEFPSVVSISIDEITATDEGIRFKSRVDVKDMSSKELK